MGARAPVPRVRVRRTRLRAGARRFDDPDQRGAWQRVLRDPAVELRPTDECGRRSSTRATCATSSASTTSGSGACSPRTTRSTPTGIRTRRRSRRTTSGRTPPSWPTSLEASAALLADRFDAVTGAQWGRPGTRSDGAHFTVESFARYLIHDPIHHLWDVEVGARRLRHSSGQSPRTSAASCRSTPR